MIPYSRQCIRPEDIEALVATLNSEYLTCGPAIERFEQELCAITGAQHCVAVASGTAALHLACLSLQFGPGDLGITSPITFVASSNCFEYCGGRSDFVDIDPSTLCLSETELERYCLAGGRPRVVIPVSYAGVPASLPGIYGLGQKYGFKVIEDAAHAIGSSYTYQGMNFQSASCAHSDLAILSFHPVKTVTTAEGGAITTNDSTIAQHLRSLRTHGIVRGLGAGLASREPWYYEMRELGFHYRITDIQCALGTSQLKLLAESKARRQAIARMYTEAFSGSAEVIPPPWPENTSPCFHLYPVRFKQGAPYRLAMYNHLKSLGIATQVHYIPVYHQPYYQKRYGYLPGKCPQAEQFYNGCLSLPMYFGLSDSEVQKVIAAVLGGCP